jgi:hypothetical protein
LFFPVGELRFNFFPIGALLLKLRSQYPESFVKVSL